MKLAARVSGVLPSATLAMAARAKALKQSGVTVFDYDGDGAPDIFLVNGAPWPWEESLEKRSGHGCALYRNDGRGHFTDVTAAAGLNTELQGMAAVAGDYDGDGRPDLFITCVGSNHLFRNLGQGHFEDMTEEAGVGGEDNTWSIALRVWRISTAAIALPSTNAGMIMAARFARQSSRGLT